MITGLHPAPGVRQRLPFGEAWRVATSRSWAEIDLGGLAENLALLRRRLGPGVRVLLPVKADAYGHGAVPIAREAVAAGVEWLGVASLEEAEELRRGGLTHPLLLLAPPLEADIPALLRLDVTLLLCDLAVARAADKEAGERGQVAAAHVEVDTGLGRTGVPWREAGEFLGEVARLPHVRLAGIFSHFHSADEDGEGESPEQLRRLREAVREAGLEDRIVLHIANSAGALRYPEAHLDVVRPGLLLYGVAPREDLLAEGEHLRPLLRVVGRVLFVKHLAAGEGVSYGRTYVATERRRVATIGLGYRDGVPWHLGGRGALLLQGRRCPILGRVCMDMLMMDVSEAPEVEVGEEAVLIGSSGSESIGACEVARCASTISYEVLCRLGSGLPRIYRRGDKVVGVTTRLGSWWSEEGGE